MGEANNNDTSEEKLEKLIEKKTSENYALKKLLDELNKNNSKLQKITKQKEK